MTQLKTLAMKAKLANHIRKTFYKRTWESLKTGERDQILLEIFSLNSQMHSELNAYKAKRKAKKVVQIEREIRGYKRKKKTSLENYKKNLEIQK